MEAGLGGIKVDMGNAKEGNSGGFHFLPNGA